ncbi:unnamed protein product [Chondrus crispus]|uniref:Uncharacterized protein n=1 Tax=Chondrus crispus TaxID=2769 RepID=R7Q6I9_CHOCR|nr:unnamed protein product [Chondrus crispus]CDF33644.1 unnamed protein product [Chondrus crispus]|eukprot:XP_005713463.1 unnamed protein product [Chondrus crispus]
MPGVASVYGFSLGHLDHYCTMQITTLATAATTVPLHDRAISVSLLVSNCMIEVGQPQTRPLAFAQFFLCVQFMRNVCFVQQTVPTSAVLRIRSVISS